MLRIQFNNLILDDFKITSDSFDILICSYSFENNPAILKIYFVKCAGSLDFNNSLITSGYNDNSLDILGYKAPKLICYSYVLLDGDKMSTSAGMLYPDKSTYNLPNSSSCNFPVFSNLSKISSK